jgi:hypothetical protein
MGLCVSLHDVRGPEAEMGMMDGEEKRRDGSFIRARCKRRFDENLRSVDDLTSQRVVEMGGTGIIVADASCSKNFDVWPAYRGAWLGNEFRAFLGRRFVVMVMVMGARENGCSGVRQELIPVQGKCLSRHDRGHLCLNYR